MQHNLILTCSRILGRDTQKIMIRYIGIILLLFSLTINGQTKKEIKQTFKEINSKEELEKYKSKNSNWKIELIELDESDSEFPEKLIKLKKGKTRRVKIDNKKYYYKLIASSKETEFRVSYIYLNGTKLTKKKIDSIRPVIIDKYQSGVSFGDLVEEYNMDGNSKKGDLGWSKKGVMVQDFEKAVLEHNKSDIFTVNVEFKKWYYVVLKTHPDRINKKQTFIRIERVANNGFN